MQVRWLPEVAAIGRSLSERLSARLKILTKA
jgi:hypothetical protein